MEWIPGHRPLAFEGFPQLHARYQKFRISRPVAITSSARSNNVCRRCGPEAFGRALDQTEAHNDTGAAVWLGVAVGLGTMNDEPIIHRCNRDHRMGEATPLRTFGYRRPSAPLPDRKDGLG
jgi:hypothetical protein